MYILAVCTNVGIGTLKRYTYMYIPVPLTGYSHICIYTYMYIYIYVYIHICIYQRVYTQPHKHTHTHTGADNIVDMASCGRYHSAAVTKNGRVFVWGNGDDGQVCVSDFDFSCFYYWKQ